MTDEKRKMLDLFAAADELRLMADANGDSAGDVLVCKRRVGTADTSVDVAALAHVMDLFGLPRGFEGLERLLAAAGIDGSDYAAWIDEHFKAKHA